MVNLKVISHILHTKHHYITPEGKLHSASSIVPSDASKVKYWIIEYYGQNVYSVQRYEYFIFDHMGLLQTALTREKWSMVVEFIACVPPTIAFKGADPSGRVVSHSTGSGIRGIVGAIAFLDEISQFKSWEQFQLQRQNELFKTTLEELTAEYKMLQEQSG